MINCDHLKYQIIIPALKHLAKYDPAMHIDSAVELLIGIAAHESKGGFYLHQVGGPALGIYQIEPATHRDVWDNYIRLRPRLQPVVLESATNQSGFVQREHDLIHNLFYSTVIARLLIWRAPDDLPGADDIWALAAYWKKYWNTELGKGKIDDFVDNYERYTTQKKPGF